MYLCGTWRICICLRSVCMHATHGSMLVSAWTSMGTNLSPYPLQTMLQLRSSWPDCWLLESRTLSPRLLQHQDSAPQRLHISEIKPGGSTYSNPVSSFSERELCWKTWKSQKTFLALELRPNLAIGLVFPGSLLTLPILLSKCVSSMCLFNNILGPYSFGVCSPS